MTNRSLFIAACILASVKALADVKVLKHDEFSTDLFVAVGQVKGQSLPVQPGFAQYEAYGLIFPIEAGSYPVKVLGLQMLFAAPRTPGTWNPTCGSSSTSTRRRARPPPRRSRTGPSAPRTSTTPTRAPPDCRSRAASGSRSTSTGATPRTTRPS